MNRNSLVTGDPPEEPPTASTAELFWRVAVRLFRDHSTRPDTPVSEPSRCERCRQPWPCSGRRLAVLGLLAAVRPRRAPMEYESQRNESPAKVTLGAHSETPPG
jgi:hypothetical protein